MRSRKILTLTALAVALAAWPAGSHAATVSTDKFCDAGVDTPCDRSLVYAAAPGEVNTVTETALSATQIRVEDPTANLTPGAGCAANGAHQVTCSIGGGFTDSSAELGDQADAFTMSGSLSSYVRGDDGADTIAGGSGPDFLQGDGGADTLRGNAGDDRFDGDASAAPAADVLDGGEGTDLVEYFLRKVPVTVDLGAPGSAGQAGENDALAGIEGAQGGSAADTLTGDGKANTLIGDGGADVIDGRGGADAIDGGKTQKGGAGDDTLTGLEEGGAVSCGAGADLVGPDAPARQLPTDCETAVVETGSSERFNVLTSRGPLKALSGDRFVFRFRCAKNADSDCSGKASVQVGGKTVGKAGVPKTKPGKRAEVAIVLPAKIAKKVRGAGVTGTFAFKPKGGRSKGYTTLLEV